jgi:hypothetical protein
MSVLRQRQGAVAAAARHRGSGAFGLHVSGNQLLNNNNQPIRLLGVNYQGSEYSCIGGWGFWDGPHDLGSVQAMASWHINTVRIPLNEDGWLGINGVAAAYSGANYQQAIVDYVNLLNSQGMYAIVDLHWSAPGTDLASGQQAMANADHSPTFWQSVANTFKNNPSVLFDLYNEPFPDSDADTTAAWTCWRDGGTGWPGVPFNAAGMQSLVDAVRGTGATNVVMVGGIQYANCLTQWLTYRPTDPINQLAAAAHVYGNNACAAQNGGACLTTNHVPVAAQVPLIWGETGETYDSSECGSGNMEVILPWADAHGVSYIAWSWGYFGDCLSLTSDPEIGTPNTIAPAGQLYATYVHDHLIAVNQTLPSIGSLVDPFNVATLNTALWTGAQGNTIALTYTTTGIVFTFPVGATSSSEEAYLLSSAYYNAAGSSITLHIISMPSAGTHADAAMKIWIDYNNFLSWGYEAGTLYAQSSLAGAVTNVATFAYSLTTHAYLRITESAGVATWWTSPDKSTWTSRGTFTHGLNLTSVQVKLFASTYQAETNAGVFKFNQLNG